MDIVYINYSSWLILTVILCIRHAIISIYVTCPRKESWFQSRAGYVSGQQIPESACLTVLWSQDFTRSLLGCLTIFEQTSLTTQPLLLRGVGILESRFKELLALPGLGSSCFASLDASLYQSTWGPGTCWGRHPTRWVFALNAWVYICLLVYDEKEWN